jgi:hypothetical protein
MMILAICWLVFGAIFVAGVCCAARLKGRPPQSPDPRPETESHNSSVSKPKPLGPRRASCEGKRGEVRGKRFKVPTSL